MTESAYPSKKRTIVSAAAWRKRRRKSIKCNALALRLLALRQSPPLPHVPLPCGDAAARGARRKAERRGQRREAMPCSTASRAGSAVAGGGQPIRRQGAASSGPSFLRPDGSRAGPVPKGSAPPVVLARPAALAGKHNVELCDVSEGACAEDGEAAPWGTSYNSHIMFRADRDGGCWMAESLWLYSTRGG